MSVDASEFVSVEHGTVTFWTADGRTIVPDRMRAEDVVQACELALSTWDLSPRPPEPKVRHAFVYVVEVDASDVDEHGHYVGDMVEVDKLVAETHATSDYRPAGEWGGGR